MRLRLLAALMSLVAVIALPLTANAAPEPAPDDVAARLAAIPGMTIVSESEPAAGFRYFVLTYAQPADHRHPERGTFTQRLTLLHRSAEAPTVLYTGGYGLPVTPTASRTEPTRLLDGNQVSVEHRFFRDSRPAPADWRRLTIWQEASDEHRIVQALKSIYQGKWLQTGGSKGGMTSVYHRRFYPGDVDAVVAYVAPNDVVNPADHAYDRFFENVGDPACRQALEDLQAEALRRRDRMVALLEADAAENGYTFGNTLGTPDRAFEMTVLDTAWAFWQYLGPADCPRVPPITATDEELYAFIDEVTFFGFYTDQGLDYYHPYYYQAATQLGWPVLKFKHLRGLTRYKNFYQPNTVLPAELRSKHDPEPMIDVDRWVRTRSERMMFVYGEYDPWGAEAFQPSRHDSYLYVAPGANHGANISLLSEADRAAATATLRRWAGLPEQPPAEIASPFRDPRPVGIPDDDMLQGRRFTDR